MKRIKINSNNGFLSFNDLPENCLFNKVITGCGGTTIALSNEFNYVIAVPTKELIFNKCGQGAHTITTINNREQTVFGLYGEFTYSLKKELEDYCKRDGIKKIMCTYDKVPKLMEYINAADYKLLVDEYHILLKAYSYRHKAIDGVLDNFKKFKSYCFMSATPINPDFRPDSLNELEEYQADWGDDIENVKVLLEQTNKPYTRVANIIDSYKKDGYIEVDGFKSYEAFFFVNSVTDIMSILNYCELSENEVKIICANGNEEKVAPYKIDNSKTPNKKFNFITSAAFEGVDYFSETGMCFVVSNSRNENTLLDISTDVYQIAGRIRTETNPFRHKIIHIFNSVGKRKQDLEIEYDEYVEKTKKLLAKEKKIIDAANAAGFEEDEITKLFDSDYVYRDENKQFKINDLIINLQLFTYKVEHEIYKSGISVKKHYNSAGMEVVGKNYEKMTNDVKKISKKLSFEEEFLMLVEEFKKILPDINKFSELVINAYNKLGVDTVRRLKYSKKAVELALINLDKTKQAELKVAKFLGENLKVGFYSNKRLKEEIKAAYEAFDINIAPKATEILKYYDGKITTRKDNGKLINGFELYKPKIVFNK